MGLENSFCQSSCVYSLFTFSQEGAPKPVSMETAKSQSGVLEVHHVTQRLLRDALKLAVKLSADCVLLKEKYKPFRWKSSLGHNGEGEPGDERATAFTG